MANNSFRARLKRLFSTQVVVRRVGKKQLKVYDSSHIQSSGARSLGTTFRTSGYRTSGVYNNSRSKTINSRHQIYLDYESMDDDSILSSALDIYADEVTMKSPDGYILNISSANEDVKKVLYNLFYDVLNIEFNLWSWVRNACKYGDFFLALDIDEEYGVVNGVPISTYEMERLEGIDAIMSKEDLGGEDNEHINPYLVKFLYNPRTIKNPLLKEVYDYFEMAHFRILSDTNFLPFGRSVLEPARKEYKRLSLMEDAMMIHRIMRAPERRIYRVSVGNINPNDIDQYMKDVINSTKKIPFVDEATGEYNLKFNLQNMTEDIYIPVRGGDSGTQVDTAQGLGNEGFIEDVDYIKNKMLAALKIPKAYLGFEEDAAGKSLLSAEDVRFSRTIERVQSIFVSELTKIAIIHLYSQGYRGADLTDFELSLNNPSIVYERQKTEIMTEKMNLVTLMKDSNLLSRKYIYENVLNLSTDEWTEQEELLINDKRLELRLTQIETEGNDPEASDDIKGTPHSLAKLHSDINKESQALEDYLSNDPNEDRGEEEQGGRPKSPRKFSTDRDKSNGRDPLGFKRVMQDTGFNSRESVELDLLKKQLKETFMDKKPLKEIMDS